MSCGIGRRHGLDPTWLWLWCRSAAVAPIGPLAWEPPYAAGAALKRTTTPPCEKKERQVEDMSQVPLSEALVGSCSVIQPASPVLGM